MKLTNLLLIGALAVAAVGGASGAMAQTAGGPEGSIYVLLPRSTAIRWERWDRPSLTAAFEKFAPKMKTIVLNAQDNAAEQERQLETALASGAKGIVLACVNPEAAGGMLAKAKAAGVPVVNHGNQCNGGPLSYRVLASYSQIGEDQSKYLTGSLPASPRPYKLALMFSDPTNGFYKAWVAGFEKYFNPLIAKGDVQIVCKADAGSWAPAKIQANMEQCLTKVADKVDAVFVMNDDTGNGVIAALEGQGLEGKVKLFGGYDGTLTGVQRVAMGWQVSDMYASYKLQAEVSAQLLVSEITKLPLPAGLVNGTVNNGFMEVPIAPVFNTLVTRQNIKETVVDAGLWSKAEICDPKGIAAKSDFCTK